MYAAGYVTELGGHLAPELVASGAVELPTMSYADARQRRVEAQIQEEVALLSPRSKAALLEEWRAQEAVMEEAIAGLEAEAELVEAALAEEVARLEEEVQLEEEVALLEEEVQLEEEVALLEEEVQLEEEVALLEEEARLAEEVAREADDEHEARLQEDVALLSPRGKAALLGGWRAEEAVLEEEIAGLEAEAELEEAVVEEEVALLEEEVQLEEEVALLQLLAPWLPSVASWRRAELGDFYAATDPCPELERAAQSGLAAQEAGAREALEREAAAQRAMAYSRMLCEVGPAPATVWDAADAQWGEAIAGAAEGSGGGARFADAERRAL
eukprot:gene8719-7777_t